MHIEPRTPSVQELDARAELALQIRNEARPAHEAKALIDKLIDEHGIELEHIRELVDLADMMGNEPLDLAELMNKYSDPVADFTRTVAELEQSFSQLRPTKVKRDFTMNLTRRAAQSETARQKAKTRRKQQKRSRRKNR